MAGNLASGSNRFQNVIGGNSRNMIVFLLFPDDFEHIFSGTKRRDIVRKFTGKANAEVGRLSALEIDLETSQYTA